MELATEFGNLCVYGTIMGIFGNNRAPFQTDLVKQMEDIRLLTTEGRNVCVIGDYNLSFADNYYFTKIGRNTVQNSFDSAEIDILTAARLECIDHIAVSKQFMAGHRVTNIDEWNLDKRLSDHKGIVVQID